MSVERRFHPRFNTNLPVTISFADENITLHGCAINLSLSGIQVQVSKEVDDSILENCQHPPEFFITIESEHLSIKRIKVRLIINRRISQQEFQLGTKFASPSETHQNSLKSFIEHCKKQ